jgi:hypothetical protein
MSLYAVVGTDAHTTDLVVPAYFDPSGSGATAWDTIATNAASVPLTAIVNPDSGPGKSADPTYITAIANVRRAGGKVIAYVHTSYGARSMSDVTADISKYLAFYSLDGFFVDEMTDDNTSALVEYYQSLYTHIKTLSADYQVVNNPGTNLPEVFASLPVADRFVVYEDKQDHYAAFEPDAWQARYPASRFIHIIYDAASSQQLDSDLQLAVQKGAGGVYITSLTVPNPYDDLPTYWSQEVAAIKQKQGEGQAAGTVVVDLLAGRKMTTRQNRLQK